MKYLFMWLAALLAAACTRGNPEVCCTTDSDCVAVGLPAGTSCGAAMACERHACVAASCAIATDCPVEAPVCSAGRCIECDLTHACPTSSPVCAIATETCGGCNGDPDCGGFSAAPICDTSSGACAECVVDGHCPATTPVCDGGCRVCRNDLECATGACNFTTGACVPEPDIVYVAITGVDAGSCPRVAPCSTPAFALTKTSSARPHVVVTPGDYAVALSFAGSTYATPVVHAAGARLVPASPTAPIIATLGGGLVVTGAELTGITSAPSIQVGAPLVLRNVYLHDTTGLEIANELTASDLRIENTTNRAAITVHAFRKLTLDRATIRGGMIGIEGLQTEFGEGATVNLTNLLVSGTSDRALACSACRGTVGFSTFAEAGAASGGQPCSVSCGSFLAVSSSIIWAACSGTGGPAIGGGCTLASTIAGPAAVPMTMTTDPLFVNPATRDYHLQATSPARDAVDTGPSLDFEGDPRPRGARFDLGADEAP